MNIQTNVYKVSNYGGLPSGLLGHLNLSSTDTPQGPSNKEIIVIIDLSQSMSYSLLHIQIALQNLKEVLDPEIFMTLIGYNNTAFELFSGPAKRCPKMSTWLY